MTTLVVFLFSCFVCASVSAAHIPGYSVDFDVQNADYVEGVLQVVSAIPNSQTVKKLEDDYLFDVGNASFLLDFSEFESQPTDKLAQFLVRHTQTKMKVYLAKDGKEADEADIRRVLAIYPSQKRSTQTLTESTYRRDTLKTRRILVIFANFLDARTTCNQQTVEDRLYTGDTNVKDAYRELSRGLYEIKQTKGHHNTWEDHHFAGPYTIDIDSVHTYCDRFHKWANRATRAAEDDGYRMNDYEHVWMFFPHLQQPCDWDGKATVADRDTKLCGYKYCQAWFFSCSPNVLMHELGHSVSLEHAGTDAGDTGAPKSYNQDRDYSCLMGKVPGWLKLNAPHMVQLRWLHKRKIKWLTQPGTYTLQYLDTLNSDSSHPFVLILPDGPGRGGAVKDYYLSIRTATGYAVSLDSAYQNGLNVHSMERRIDISKYVTNVKLHSNFITKGRKLSIQLDTEPNVDGVATVTILGDMVTVTSS